MTTVLLASFFGSPARAASFDCRLARTSVEQTVCLDAELSRADEAMALAFKQAVAAAPAPLPLRQAQRDWLRLVRNRCETHDCLAEVYAERIARLRAGRPLDLSATAADASAGAALAAGETAYLPTTVEFEQRLGTWLKQTRAIESAVDLVRRYVSAQTLPRIIVRHCAAQAGGGAYYIEAGNQVHVCYEFIGTLLQAHDAIVKNGQSTWETEQPFVQAAIKFLVWHEIAHGLLRRDGGSAGPEEAAADNIAGVLLLAHASDEAEVRQAVWGVHRLTAVMGPRAVYTDTEYADEHLLPQQRFAAIACLAVGRDPTLTGWLGKILPERRAGQCKADWPRKLTAINALLARIR